MVPCGHGCHDVWDELCFVCSVEDRLYLLTKLLKGLFSHLKLGFLAIAHSNAAVAASTMSAHGARRAA